MARFILCLLVLGLSSLEDRAGAQQPNSPAIVSERLQEIAQGFPIAERLEIKWDSASPEDVGALHGAACCG